MRQVIIYRGEDNYWVVEVPSLPGCVSQGRTRQDALENIREAIALYIEELEAHGEDVPGDYGPIGVETVSAKDSVLV